MQDLASEVGIFTNWVKCQEHHKERNKYICKLVNYLKESVLASIVFKTRSSLFDDILVFIPEISLPRVICKKNWSIGGSLTFP